MIAILSLLGSGLLLGGGYAIWDGWPYLVLERGFTQVILGAIAVATGLALLAQALVLREFGRMREGLAAMAGSVPAVAAPAVSAPVSQRDAAEEAVLAGAAAAAGLAVTTAVQPAAAASARPETVDAATPDLLDVAGDPSDAGTGFAAPETQEPELAIGWTAEPESDAGPHALHLATEPEPEPEVEDVVDVTIDPGPAAFDESRPEVEPEADSLPPAGEGEAEPTPADIPWPRLDSPDPDREVPWPRLDVEPESAADDDELGSLRRHLNLGPRFPETVDPDVDALERAGSWMDRPAAEPPVEPTEPTEPAGEAEEPEPPVAPDPSFATGDAPREPDPWTWPDEIEAPPEAPEPDGSDMAETSEPPPEPGPAASEEGVIGAYQVGDTHFTMYADGSIRARTRDGEYSFASMDELKTYLASEKSRLDS